MGTLNDSTSVISGFIDTLRQHCSAAWFQQAREGTRIDTVFFALGPPTWKLHLDFVDWYTSWLGRIMLWGSGCDHGDACPFASCMSKGRRLHRAHTYAMERLAIGLKEANDWTPDAFGVVRAEAHGCVRSTVQLVKHKLDSLDNIPWLLARLEEAGVAARCVANMKLHRLICTIV